ncbi:MAG: glycosyltransferase, partial [Lachnospiraceae bacterium]|nr:glycosyltransferase [Lachnospiraceae bacterium]
MLISIIMPYYKGIHFLRDAMDSIKHSLSNCTVPEVSFELIVVIDDGEAKENEGLYRDEALSLLDEYRSACEENLYIDIKAITVNGRYTVAMLRNEGVRASAGDYIYYMDSDDYILSDTLQAMAEAVRTGCYDIITGPIEQTMFKYAT